MNLHNDSGEESPPPVTSPTAIGATGRSPEEIQGSGEVDRGAQLMQLWQAGDDAAFDELVRLYSDHVYALLTRFLGRFHSGREDLVLSLIHI